MVAKLHDIRNRVEHQDSSPPDVDECAQFAEFVWYFLKSTDSLASVVPDGFCINPRGGLYDDPYGLTVNTGPECKWGIQISGWVPGEWIASDPPTDWMVLECDELVKASDVPRKKPRAIGRLRKNTGDDTWIIGRVVETNGHGDSIFELYFKAD
jgi:hypothetical protein